jgi:hypothetical protein
MPMKPHGATQYRNGCRCAVCRGAEAARQRRYRARNPNAQIRGPKPNVVALPSRGEPTAPQIAPNGEVEQAVRAQLAGMPKADERQGEAAAAIRLAQLLDDPSYFALASQNSYKLHTLLKDLGTPKKKSRGRLQAIESMYNRKPKTQAAQ